MKQIKTVLLPMLTFMAMVLLQTCEQRADYSHLVFKNYLTYEINRASAFLNEVVEGDKEGEYNPGSKQLYQEVISEAEAVSAESNSNQAEIDNAYEKLLQAAEDFFDEMVPIRSEFVKWIDYAEILLGSTEEGQEEGNVKPGSKQILQAAVHDANATVERQDLIQRELDIATTELTEAIYEFNGSIIGKASTAVKNHGFEKPGHETEDFSEVDGWTLFGNVEAWAPKTSISLHEMAPEGQFVTRFGSYTQGLYQVVPELVNPNADYALNFKVSLLSNQPDWQGKTFPAILRSRLVVFEQAEGDFDFATVLSETFDTLGIDPTGFLEKNYSLKIDAISGSIGKPISIVFEQRHTWDGGNPIWAESFVAIDDVRLYRKL